MTLDKPDAWFLKTQNEYVQMMYDLNLSFLFWDPLYSTHTHYFCLFVWLSITHTLRTLHTSPPRLITAALKAASSGR